MVTLKCPSMSVCTSVGMCIPLKLVFTIHECVYSVGAYTCLDLKPGQNLFASWTEMHFHAFMFWRATKRIMKLTVEAANIEV